MFTIYLNSKPVDSARRYEDAVISMSALALRIGESEKAKGNEVTLGINESEGVAYITIVTPDCAANEWYEDHIDIL